MFRPLRGARHKVDHQDPRHRKESSAAQEMKKFGGVLFTPARIFFCQLVTDGGVNHTYHQKKAPDIDCELAEIDLSRNANSQTGQEEYT